MTHSIFSSRMVAGTVWLLVSIFYAYQYILRVMPNIMIDEIMQQFGIGAGTFGQFSGVYYLAYSLMHLPIGLMLDRVGPRKTMTGCILLTVVGLMPLLFATHWIYPVVGRLLIGMGSSAAILGVFKIVRMIFDERLFPRMLSFSVTIGLIGAIYGGGPVSFMRDTLGYETVVQLLALGGILLALATYAIVPDIKTAPHTSVAASVKHVLTNKRVIWTCLFAGLMVGPLEGFADVWGTAFFKHVYLFDSTVAASVPSMIFFGMCFGGPVLTFIADKVGSYLAVIVGAGSLMAASFILLLGAHMSPMAISISFFLVGICCAYQILAIYKASTYVSEEFAGLATALANMIIMTFGYAFHSVIGAVVNAYGGSSVPEALTYGVAVIPIALAVGTIGFAILFFQQKKYISQGL